MLRFGGCPDRAQGVAGARRSGPWTLPMPYPPKPTVPEA